MTAAAFCWKCKNTTEKKRKECETRTNMFQSTNCCVQYIFRTISELAFGSKLGCQELGVLLWLVSIEVTWTLNIEKCGTEYWGQCNTYVAADTFQFIMQTFHCDFIVWLVNICNRLNEFTYNHRRWSEVMSLKWIIFILFFIRCIFWFNWKVETLNTEQQWTLSNSSQ